MRGIASPMLSLAAPLGPAAAGEIRWPDPGIPVPAHVAAYIAAECADGRRSSDEEPRACISGEAYGYRAVVEMLSAADHGAFAAERYRACAAGLGAHGGRFHRRKADCVGAAFGYKWRFEFSERAALDGDEPFVRAGADPAAPLPLQAGPIELQHALRAGKLQN